MLHCPCRRMVRAKKNPAQGRVEEGRLSEDASREKFYQRPLSQIPTCELQQELIRREGVEATFLGPRDEITKFVIGPAWVVVNRD